MKKPRPKKRIPRSPDECASQLKEAFAFARAHPLSMIEMDASPDQCFQAVEEQTVLVPKPTKVLVVFSYELQRRGPCWHLSFFNRENSRELPDKTTVEAILDTVGLPRVIKTSVAYMSSVISLISGSCPPTPRRINERKGHMRGHIQN